MVIGLTGGIGTGKTQVSRILEELGTLELVVEKNGRWRILDRWRGLLGNDRPESAYPDSPISERAQQALQVLARFPEGLQLKDWRQHAGFTVRTSKRVALALVSEGFATKVKRGWYRIADKGRNCLNSELRKSA